MSSPEAATVSVYTGFVYRPRREAPRKGAHEKTVGHEWVCQRCKRVVHSEPWLGFDVEETHEEAAARHQRIEQACHEHGTVHEEVVEAPTSEDV